MEKREFLPKTNNETEITIIHTHIAHWPMIMSGSIALITNEKVWSCRGGVSNILMRYYYIAIIKLLR